MLIDTCERRSCNPATPHRLTGAPARAVPARATSPRSLAALAALLVLVAVSFLLLLASPAPAATGDVGFAGPSTAGTGGAASGEKPESKLWWNDGRWWASLYHAASGTYHIWWLDRSASPERWVDSGAVLDNRPKSRADTLWDGRHLYVASAIFATSNTTVVNGDPTRLYRYSYDATLRTYKLDAGFPVNINNTSSETITIDEDSNQRLWATWTQGRQVYFNATTGPGNDSSWGTPRVLPVTNATGLDPDDISSVVAFGTPVSQGGSGGQIGVMWSNQAAATTYFSIHNDDDPDATWQPPETVTLPGPGQSDDHLNIKDLQTDDRGRVFAVIKTSLDDVAGSQSSAPQIVVLARATKGGWSRGTFGTLADCHTRPILVIDASNELVHVYATAPDSGCPFSGSAGTIFEKTSPIDKLAFASGRGTPVMRNSASPNLNNASATKQTVNTTTGIVLLASDDVAKQYWSSDQSISAPSTTPTASFTASPTSGAAPLTVQFTDTSTGSPSAWSWSFGDGTTSTAQNPTHTYTDPGSYTATLTASNSSGSSQPATRTIAVTAPTAAISVVGSASSLASSAASAVTLSTPGGASAGDVLVAAFTVDNRPTVTAPDGWTPIVTALKPNSGAEVFAYYHVVAPGETAGSYSWGLSAAQKWGGGITAYRGVDASHPLDIASAATKIDGTGTATSITLSGVVTVTNGAMLIGGLGADGATATTTAPSGWTEAFDSIGGKMSEHAYMAQSAAGSSGSATWTISSARAMAVWMTALRPAS
jgi:PKD repeat protein